MLCGVDLADLLLGGADEVTCCHRNQPWATFNDVSRLTPTAADCRKESTTGLEDPLTHVPDVS